MPLSAKSLFTGDNPVSAGSSVREFPVMAPEAFIGLPGDIVQMIEPQTQSDPAGLLRQRHISSSATSSGAVRTRVC